MTMQMKPTFAQLLPLLAKLEWTPGRTMEPRSYLANHKGWTFQLDTIALSASEPGARRGRGHTWHGPDVREFAYDVGDHIDCTAPDWTALYATDDHDDDDDEPVSEDELVEAWAHDLIAARASLVWRNAGPGVKSTTWDGRPAIVSAGGARISDVQVAPDLAAQLWRAATTSDSILDDPRMDGEQWIAPTDEECDAWPFWEYRTSTGIEIMTAQEVRAMLRLTPRYRPLRLPGMNERGEIAAANMTSTHFERVSEWQWCSTANKEPWQTHTSAAHIAYVDAADPSERWRPAIFATLDQPGPSSAEPTTKRCSCDEVLELRRQIAEAMKVAAEYAPNTTDDSSLLDCVTDAIQTTWRLMDQALDEAADLRRRLHDVLAQPEPPRSPVTFAGLCQELHAEAPGLPWKVNQFGIARHIWRGIDVLATGAEVRLNTIRILDAELAAQIWRAITDVQAARWMADAEGEGGAS